MLGEGKTEERQEQKRTRIPVGGARFQLQLSPEDMKRFEERQMVPYWFNHEGGRIEAAKAGGYDFVKPEHAGSLGGGALAQGNTDVAGKVSKIVSKGEPVIRAYLMEIPKQYWLEDQAAKEAVNAQVDDALALGGAQAPEFENAYKPT